MISRRIESNERSAINICWLYVALQAVYARKIRIPGQSAGVYAQKLRSDPGTHNGLDWEEETGGESSPAGRIFPLAAQEGYGPECGRQLPFHGYYLGVLTGQGKDAPGGEKNYIVSEKMTAGFAMVAYPAKYGSSGIKTFIVNHDGTVYQKDFGRQTERLADQMIKYNPDPSWSRVD